MQKRRTPLRIGRIIDKLVNIAFWLVMAYAIVQIASAVKEIREVQQMLLPRGSSVTTHSFLPGNYSEKAYQAAMQRYNIEQGLFLPGEKTEN